MQQKLTWQPAARFRPWGGTNCSDSRVERHLQFARLMKLLRRIQGWRPFFNCSRVQLRPAIMGMTATIAPVEPWSTARRSPGGCGAPHTNGILSTIAGFLLLRNRICERTASKRRARTNDQGDISNVMEIWRDPASGTRGSPGKLQRRFSVCLLTQHVARLQPQYSTPRFPSRRERRLWTWTLGIVAGIDSKPGSGRLCLRCCTVGTQARLFSLPTAVCLP